MTKPCVTNSNHLLPFGELSSIQFERLCLWLVERKGYLRAEALGVAGNEQGRDVTAYRATESGEQLWYFQCKRRKTISAAILIEELDRINALSIADPTKKPFGIVFVTNAVISAAARAKVRHVCSRYSFECEFWAGTELDMLVKKYSDVVAEFFNVAVPRPVSWERISIARLPVSAPDLFGRSTELQLLDEGWDNPNVNIITFVAWGGVGKTALVNHWVKQRIQRENCGGADRIYGWSFYSQGTSERTESADLFIDHALRWFGDTDPSRGSPWEKGERLAGLIRQSRTLLILDGLEPLQHPAGQQEGRLKDAALHVLLVEIAAQQPGLCVISTRERIADLVEFEKATVVQHNLEHLTPHAGALLLRAFNIKGNQDELEAAAREYEGHALALTLLGSYLSDVYGGDIRRRSEIDSLRNDVRHGGHAERVMRAYEEWLGHGVELAILRLLGLFDQPADVGCITALRNPPPIMGLTEPLFHWEKQSRRFGLFRKGSALPLYDYEWQQALATLRRLKLLGAASANDPNTLDAHPLVREHFREQLKRTWPSAWQEANSRLYVYLKSKTKLFPDTNEEMASLYLAVKHGGEAKKHQEVLDDVYTHRVQRMSRPGEEFFSTTTLGAYAADLAALVSFFEKPWEQTVSNLKKPDKARVLAIAGYDLLTLGRLGEAVQPMRAQLRIRISLRDWKNAGKAAYNLSETYLTMGHLDEALSYAQQSIELAAKSGDTFEISTNKAGLGNCLHYIGRFSESEIMFEEAEKLQREIDPNTPYLYSKSGYEYCELLMSQGKREKVLYRITHLQRLVTRARGVRLSDLALIDLYLGSLYFLEGRKAKKNRGQAISHLNRAVDGLRHAGELHLLPRGLLARATLYRIVGDYTRAERDLTDTLRISTRGEMGLYLADHHLETAWLHLARGNQHQAREYWTMARGMIERMGYHRRDSEINEVALHLT